MTSLRGLGLALLLALLPALPLQAQPTAGGPIEPVAPVIEELAPTIVLLTFAPGEVYWQRFGHNALLVRDPVRGEDRVYNYGIFDFHQKNFFLNFARGHMLYQLAAEPLARTLEQYQYEGRAVQAQELDLDPAQRRELAAFLAWNARPENAEYRYDYFLSNCSTRVRDAIDRVTGGALKRQLEGQMTPVSYRFEATRLIAPVRPMLLLMDATVAAQGDAPIDRWQQSFVPMELMKAVRAVRLRDANGQERPLVRKEAQILDSRRPPEPSHPPSLVLPLGGLGLGLAIALLLLERLRPRGAARGGIALLGALLALSSGLGGLALLGIWALTDHWVMWANYNLLLFSPLALLLLPAWLRGLRRGATVASWERRLGLLLPAGALLALLLWLLPGTQHNLHWILLWLPLHLALAWTLWRAPHRP